MKTKVAWHVPRINVKHLTHWKTQHVTENNNNLYSMTRITKQNFQTMPNHTKHDQNMSFDLEKLSFQPRRENKSCLEH